MDQKGKVLLVHREDAVLEELRRVLELLGLEAVRVSGCTELEASLRGGPFLTIFTEASMPDGEYKDVCRIASESAPPLPVIVVAPYVDVRLYLDTMENGASDFVVPPFLCTDIAYVLMTALSDQISPRGTRTPYAVGTA